MAAISVAKLAEYLEHSLNIYISGEAGTGKTEKLRQAAKDKNFVMGYMSAPTLDAYVDLVGIPVAKKDKARNKQVLKFIRKQDFDDIEVLFIDELPRGELKTLNAVFEIIQFGTINGEKAMPKLRCVVAAGNPISEDYSGQQELDTALLDRFDMYLETDIAADRGYFINIFGRAIGNALVDWHDLHDHKEKGYLSPRRLEKIGHTWLKMPEIGTIKAMVPPNGDFNVDLLQRQLKDAQQGARAQNDPNAPLVSRVVNMRPQEVRQLKDEIIAELPNMNSSDRARLTEIVAKSIGKGIRVKTVVDQWGPALEYFSNSDKVAMMADWQPDKNREFQIELAEKNIRVGSKLRS